MDMVVDKRRTRSSGSNKKVLERVWPIVWRMRAMTPLRKRIADPDVKARANREVSNICSLPPFV